MLIGIFGHTLVSLRFYWYDFWIGIFYDKQHRILYICPLPMLCLVINFGVRVR